MLRSPSLLPGIVRLDPKSPRRAVLSGLLIAAAALLAHAPALAGGFVFDDHVLVERSALLEGPLWRIWFTTAPVDFWPLSYTSFWLEWRLWGGSPLGHHAVNLLLHAATAVLLWRALLRLRVPGAWVAGLLFAVHPVTVESVAWISERKNVLSGVLFVATILVWTRWREEGSRGSYLGALGLFALALLAKTSTVVLPVVLLGLAASTAGRLRRRDLVPLAPFFLLSVAAGVVTLWFQWVRAMAATPTGTTLAERIGGSAWALLLYARTALVPVRLAFVYPPWPVSAPYFYVPLAVVPALAAALWWARRGPARPLSLALGYHALVVLPVVGLVDMAFFMFGPASNHLQYLALLGPAALGGWAVARLAASGARRWAVVVAAGAILALGAETARRASAFESDLTLWQAAAADAPQSLVAALLYAEQVAEHRTRAEALAVLAGAAERIREPADRHRARAMLLLQLRQVDEAIDEARAAAAIRPDPLFDLDIGKMLGQAHRYPEAVEVLAPLVAREPRSPEYRSALAGALVGAGRAPEAAQVAREACRLAPESTVACVTFVRALASAGRAGDARDELGAALRVSPGDPAVDAILSAAGFQVPP